MGEVETADKEGGLICRGPDWSALNWCVPLCQHPMLFVFFTNFGVLSLVPP
jgi:hypothetical protein